MFIKPEGGHSYYNILENEGVVYLLFKLDTNVEGLECELMFRNS
ncbi:hypothetical protein CZ797_14700 [Pseudoalteromonas sp. JB197]|nr:hypothetical protein CZ797_14700 [Pseudoalteromonas sp. JB197]